MAYNYDIATLKKAIDGSGGMYQVIAKRLGCSWHTAKTHVESSEEAKEAYQDEVESTIDLAESKLIENIQDNDNTAIIFFLKTRAKHRGYVEKSQVDLTSNGKELKNTVNVIVHDPKTASEVEKLMNNDND